MKKSNNFVFLPACFLLLFTSCGIVKPAVSTKMGDLSQYKYMFITNSTELSSSSSGMYSNTYGLYGSSTSKTVNPSDIIVGYFIKNGFIRVQDITPDIAEQTISVSYGESGRRACGLGYAIEVTIQCVDASKQQVICVCPAEGKGETEADDIRKALNSCLKEIFSDK